MHFDGYMAIAGLIVGFTVGLTGMGGGALMTPILVLLFKIQPLAAVSSDLVAAVVMKPVGGGVHLKHGTVNRPLVKWLMIGSVPSAFLGVLVLRLIGLGFIALVGGQYVILWLTGKLFNPLPDPGFVPLSTIVAIQFVPLLAICAVIATFTWRRTGSSLPGALICGLFVTWYVVAGTATQAAF